MVLPKRNLIILSISKHMVPCIHVDPHMLLCFTKVDAMPDFGELTVTSNVSPLGLVIVVQDTGQGIKKRDMAKIFTPFSRRSLMEWV